MPTLTEKLESRQHTTGENPSIVIQYQLDGVADDLTAKTLVLNSTATTYDGLVRQSIDLDAVWVDTTVPDGLWDVTVRYGKRPAPAETGESTFTFDTTGGTQHITESLATSGKFAPSGKTAPENHKAIGYNISNGSADIQGVDITVPVYAWTETHYMADADVNKGNIYALTGKVNSGTFRGFAAGEVLFLGASGSKRGSDEWEITFRFAASPNRTNFTIGTTSPITVSGKKGWEYMWVRYEDDVDTASKRMTRKPVAVYVEKVYDEGDMAGLGIGT
jgi:hypothetical protein